MENEPFACERCGKNTRMQVQVVISAPSELAHRFSKRNLRRKDVYIMGVLWETADFICPSCGNVTRNYGTYVKNLKIEIEELKEKLNVYIQST
jgi:transcription elongation factor Elf1